MCPKVVKEAAPGVLAQIDIAKEVANYDQDEGTFGGVPRWRLSGADRSKKSVEPEIHPSLWSLLLVREAQGLIMQRLPNECLQSGLSLIKAKLRWTPASWVHFKEYASISS